MSSEPEFRDISTPLFRSTLYALGLLFVGLQLFIIVRLPLVMDEFVDAEIVHCLASKLPYRDLPLGKTVLGYYVQLPVMIAAETGWTALLAVKVEMAVAALAAIIYAAFVLTRDYSRTAVLLGTVLLVTMNTFYERAADFRSDMLTGVTGLVALLYLIRGRPGRAGFWCGISLMMSQKAAFYVLATEAALAMAALIFRRREQVRDFLLFNVVSAATFGAYLAFWMVVSSPHSVLYNTFVAQQTNAFVTHFANIRWTFWSQTLRRNPLFYATAAAALVFLARRAFERREIRDVLLAVYSFALTALCMWHKQPWPYFFVLLVPFLFVAQVPLLDALCRAAEGRYRRIVFAGVVVAAATSLLFRVPALLSRDSGYQRATFHLGSELLRSGGTYFAGTPIFYNVPQAGGAELNSVDTVQRQVLESLTPGQLMAIVRRFDAQPVKFILFNYRIDALPLLLRQYLVSTFEPYWGGIFIYAPKVRSGTFALHFDGLYVVESTAAVSVDGEMRQAGARIHLTRGAHTAGSSTIFRLRLDPDNIAPYLDPRYRAPEDFFPAVYDF